MLELFKAEFIRYRYWTLLVLTLHLLTLSIFAKLGPVLEPLNQEVSLLIMVMCFAFGFIQMILHKRKNHWGYLLQRPLKARKIYLALATAGVLNIIIVVPTAWFVTVIGFDYFTDTVIDMRHYFFALFLAGIGIITYLIGSLVALNASRAAILTGLGLFVIFQSVSEYIWLQSSIAILIVVYLAYLNIASFKPDITQPLKSGLSTVLLAVPMQMMIVLLLLFSTQIFYQAPKFMLASNPSELIVEGTIDYWRDLDVEKRVEYLLKDSDVANKDWLVRQAELAKSDVIYIHTRSFSKRGQYPFRDKNFSLEDKENNNLWVFSHDEMLLQGVSIKTGKVVGWLGKNGFIESIISAGDNDRFNRIPFMMEDRIIATKKTIYRVDFEAKELIEKVNFTEEEQMIGRPQFTQGYAALVSNKQTYLFELRDLFEENALAFPAFSLPHPTELSLMTKIDTFEMVDGFLLVYSGSNYHGFDRPGTEVIYAKRDDGIQYLYKSSFKKHNDPALIRHFEYLVSPLLDTLKATINYSLRALPDEKHPLVAVFARNMPVLVNIVALILQILSIATVFWVSRLIRLDAKKTRLWVILTTLIGLPAMLSFFFINNVRGNIFSEKQVVPSAQKHSQNAIG